MHGHSVPRPNIVLVLADDLGFSDLGCYGGEVRTPVLDQLGRSGVRLSSFYNSARCSPSRASLLTGLHPHQTGIGVLTRRDEPAGYAGNLADACTTIAEALRNAGWLTWMAGKWHLSADTKTPNSSWPTRRGFERFFGTLTGGSYYNPRNLMRDEEAASDAFDDPDFYFTDAISDEAVRWIEGRSKGPRSKPFFLYLAYTAPHWPLQAPESDVAAYDGVYEAGWDVLRSDRLERLVDEGIMPAGTPLSARDPSQPSWDDAPDRLWQARRMQVYAAQVERMDRGLGRVIEALRRSGAFDETLVLFLSDNGASAEELPIGDLDTFKQKDIVGFLDGTRDGRPIRVGNDSLITPGPEDTFCSYGVPWANLSNAPLRHYKRWVHEGGISTPFLISWPNGALHDGAVIHTPFQLVDVVPTLLEAAGISEDIAPLRNGLPLEGRSMLPAWRGDTLESASLFWEHVGNAAIRRDRWKLVRDFPGAWELYDIEADRTESNDVAAEYPHVVSSLSQEWHEWASRVGVIPWDEMLDDYRQRGLTPEDAEE